MRARRKGDVRWAARPCDEDGCDEQRVARGKCTTHYQRLVRVGDTSPPERRDPECTVPGCERPHFGRGWCTGHYNRWAKHGDIRADEPLAAWRPRMGYINAKGYRVTPDGQLEHREVMAGVVGRPLYPDEQVHHRNAVRDDNRPENLELWTVSHPAGARVNDVVAHALEMLRRYAPEHLRGDRPAA